ncbi:MAG TPA: sortase [Streptosporangiaceae bacterium]|nr:sortase [Streptosporangiaceae bacterium]
MQWRRAVKPLAWTLVACVLATAAWAAFMITDPLAGSRQDAVQDKLYHQWQRPAQDTAAGGGGNGGSAADRGAGDGSGSRGSAAHRSVSGTAAGGTGDRPGSGRSGYTGASPDGIRPRTGQPFAMMRVPAFGKDWKFAIVEGTSLRQLALGPGHVPGTGLPGQRGNFVVAAHDITAGNPFMHLRSLHKPDKVLIYTRDHVYTYRVQTNKVLRYTKVAVMYPVPGHPGKAPTQGRITLITCTPVTLNFTPWRIVVTGELVKVAPR